MVAHEVLPIKNNGLPKKNFIFILGHFEWPRERPNFIHQNAIFIFPQMFLFILSDLKQNNTTGPIYKTIFFQLPVFPWQQHKDFQQSLKLPGNHG